MLFALNVLESLKLYLNDNRCVYVIGMDRQVIETSIKQQYKDLELDEAEYLDKIVQLPFNIPPVHNESLSDFVSNLLPEHLKEASKILSSGLDDNPRNIKRFVNSFILNSSMAAAHIGESYDCNIMAGVLLIQHSLPDLFKKISHDYSFLDSLLGEDQVKSEKREDALKDHLSLANALSMIAYKDGTNVAPYIHLSAATSINPSNFSVDLINPGPNKIDVIKRIRLLTGIELADATAIVDSVPSTISKSLSESDAKKIYYELEQLSASVEIN